MSALRSQSCQGGNGRGILRALPPSTRETRSASCFLAAPYAIAIGLERAISKVGRPPAQPGEQGCRGPRFPLVAVVLTCQTIGAVAAVATLGSKHVGSVTARGQVVRALANENRRLDRKPGPTQVDRLESFAEMCHSGHCVRGSGRARDRVGVALVAAIGVGCRSFKTPEQRPNCDRIVMNIGVVPPHVVGV